MSLTFEKVFNVGGKYYKISLTRWQEIILENFENGWDEFCCDYPTTMYSKNANPYIGMLVYRIACKEIVNFLFNKNIKYFTYSTDGISKRSKLYTYFAEKLKMLGFDYYLLDDVYIFIKKIEL